MKKEFRSTTLSIYPMPKSIFTAFFVAVTFFVSFLTISTDVKVLAQETTTGEWTAKISEKEPDKIQLSFSRRTAKGGNNMHGSGFSFGDLQGLSREQIAKANVPVKFQLVREAGTIDCEGTFNNGRGSGTFRFTPNQTFVSAMQSRGFSLNEDKLFAATTLNLTTAFVDDLKSMGFENLDTEDLFKAVIFKITPQFAQEMKAAGFPNLDIEDLVKARIFKVDADFVRKVREMGFKESDMESLVKLRIFKVTPEFIKEMQAEGLTNLDIEDLVQLRIFKVDAEFVRRAKTENANINVEELVRMRIHGGRNK